MDIFCPTDETPAVLTPRFTLSVTRQWRRLSAVIALLPCLAGLNGCERIKRQLDRESSLDGGSDPIWQGDSTFLAARPSVVLRILDTNRGRFAVPVATIGANGFRRLRLSPRGWRAFDITYLHRGNSIRAVKRGVESTPVSMARGMWESGNALDTLPCRNVIPAGLVDAKTDASLAVVNTEPKLKPVSPLSSGELQEALATVPTLVAPSAGIPTSMLAKYKREMFELPTGTSTRPSILLIYTDPEVVSDTLSPLAQRPRQLVLILDRGVYGYRPSYKFTTLGNAVSAPKLNFLDMIDVDSDGKAELFFGFIYNKAYDGTFVLRFENDAWRETYREGLRCQ